MDGDRINMIIKDPDRTWFTADNHFGHENIIDFQKRPYLNTGVMDRDMIERWNARVQPSDTVYHLGDFTLGYAGRAIQILKKLNGTIFMLYTSFHHDRRWLSNSEARKYVRVMPPLVALECPAYGDGEFNLPIILCHYPMAEWDRRHYGSWHLHGHSHGEYAAPGNILDVGVDCWDYAPIALTQIKLILDTKRESEALSAK